MARAFSAWIVRHPHLVIIVVIALTALFALGLRRGIEVDVSPLSFTEKANRGRVDYEAARHDFGDDLYLVVAITMDEVFTRENIAKLRALSDGIKRISGVAEAISVVDVPYARSTGGGASLEKLIPAGEVSDERLREARTVATSDRLFVGNLVSADGRTAAFNILIDPRLPTVERHRITKTIYEMAHGSGFPEVYFAGDPFSQLRSTEGIRKDLTLLLPVTLLFIAVVLWLSFRCWIAVVLPLVTIGLGLAWLFGIMGYAGAHFTILALMLPTLLLAIGCSYLIHVFNQVGLASAAAKPGATSREIIRDALSFITLPVVVSALTITAGFLSLAFTRIPAIRETAFYAALGALCTMALSLTFVPAVLALVGRRAIAFSTGLHGSLVPKIESIGRMATTRESWLYIATAIVVILSLIGMRRIEIDIDYFHFFRAGSDSSVGLAEVSRRLAGAVNFDLILEGTRAGDLETPAALERISTLQQFAETKAPGIDRTLSIVDFIRHVNRAFHDNEPQYYAIPDDPGMISDLLSDRRSLSGFITGDGRKARILVRSRLSASRDMAVGIREVERRGRELFPDFRVYATGTIVLMNRTSDMIGRDQVQSITIALLAIYVMLALLFRSWRVGLTALIPNLVPVLFFFGFMGWYGIPLNITTSLVASVVLGLAVDNSVQFIVRFRRVLGRAASVREAIVASLRLSGRPIIYANIALAATFAIFSVSSFQPIASFGLLSAVTILGCLVEDLLLLPARLTSPVFRAHGKHHNSTERRRAAEEAQRAQE